LKSSNGVIDGTEKHVVHLSSIIWCKQKTLNIIKTLQ
jgi:hypothetical protein